MITFSAIIGVDVNILRTFGVTSKLDDSICPYHLAG
jgi:hypothetical protein